jgi:hypothetical protein
MSYSDFDLRGVCDQFGLRLDESQDLFSGVDATAPDDRLAEVLAEWAPAALAQNTERARSEMIIAPVLMAAVRASGRRLNLFSGITFDVDRERGLTGVCDYLLSRSSERFVLRQPVAAVVEAKRENIPAGLGQCLAEMVAAREYNGRTGPASPVYGAVTTGSTWRFLKLDGEAAAIDRPEYYLPQTDKVLGIFRHIAGH